MKGRGGRERSGVGEGGVPLSPFPESVGGDPHGRGHQDRGAPRQGLLLRAFGVCSQGRAGWGRLSRRD